MTKITKRDFLAGSAVLAGGAIAMPSVLRAQATVLRWGEMLPATHPQVQMVERIAKQVKEKSSGRIDIQTFPAGQLGSGKDMMESVASGALTMTTDGAAALGLAGITGQLTEGFRADIAVHAADDFRALPYWFGERLCRVAWAGGRACHPST